MKTLMRMTTLITAVLAALISSPMVPAMAADEWHHAMSLIGTPQYAPDFKHFDWVNPAAPKGGSVTLADYSPFDTLNGIPAGANVAPGFTIFGGLIYDSLMADSADEGSTEYGLLAEAASYPEDRSSVTYRLRKEARFNDGTPVTPEDVIWSFQKSKDISPFWGQYYKNVEKAEKTGERDVTFRFTVKGNRELPQIVGQLGILPMHWWTGKDTKGNQRDLSKATTEIPVGSGPYRIKSVELGRNIVYERVPDYWGKDLPLNVGQNNLDTIKFITYGDQTVAFEAFKVGEVDFHAENSAKRWATGYDFKAITTGAVKKEVYPLKTPQGMQGFSFNLRRAKFADRRVREAFDLAFDFEWSNKNLFYGQYTRAPSYFTNSEYVASGLPSGRELEILNEVKDKVPPEVFSTEYKNPVNATPDDLREHIRKALQLLKDAGWESKGGVMTNVKTGEALTVEVLLSDNTFERILNPYFQGLKRIGVTGTIRVVDEAQYVQRDKSFDYEMVIGRFAQSDSPGNEQREFWGSAAADLPGSRNAMGIKDPAVDKLIDHVILAKDHADLVAATKALDRVLLWNHYLVPQWYLPSARLAYWDKFRHPEHGPSRSDGFPTVWWFDKDAAAKIDAAKGK